MTHPEAVRIHWCLVSHTNVGKTSLTRTLLGQDVGEVRDAAHVTQQAEQHALVVSEHGDELLLWDTPGLGDSLRLYQRLRRAGQPLGWFLSQVWDRWTDPAFYLSQRAMLTARDHADVVLYLVSAAEGPEDAGYLAPELHILAWMNKPVLVLLNQLGQPADATRDAQALARWRAHLQGFACVREVLPLDAFSRCWVHEAALFRAVAPCLAPAQQAGFQRLEHQWQQRHLQRFVQAMAAMADALVRTAQPLRADATLGRDSPVLAQRLADQVAQAQRDLSRDLLAQHGLSGQAGQPHWRQLEERLLSLKAPTPVVKMGLLGAVTSGAASGLGADLMTGGLSLGAGALVGAVVGAMGFAGAALAANKTRGLQQAELRLSAAAWQELLEVALLTYLAVAHFGRGRGAYVDEAAPEHWQTVVNAEVAAASAEVVTFWRAMDTRSTRRGTPPPAAQNSAPLETLLGSLTLRCFKRLYPALDVQLLEQQLQLHWPQRAEQRTDSNPA